MKKLLIVIFFFSLLDTTFGQSRFSIGIQGGVSKLSTFSGTLGNELPGFSPKSTVSGLGQIHGTYTMNSNLFARVGVGGMHLGMSTTMEGLQGNVLSLGNQTLNPQLIASLGKNFQFGTGGWGGYLAAGISMTKLDLSGERIYSLESEEGIRFQGALVTNDQGAVGEVLAHNMRIYNTGNNILWHVRPEVGVFKQIGKSKISLAFIYGYQLREELYVVSYNSLSLFEGNYSETHGTSGSFVSLQMGYEFSF
ncbi:hypothetical protein SAMN03080617_00986 [Algoriphagus alkaliphilus]|uniref:Outer membrane protein beta-barrel domain-containing protein n=1 Tax=Algoriphagus alkaliphilus TaxID=279824 RepID=A0A1G5WAW6_9BACT|nr:hypothetical protein [Algoriphagus alkaliphilus]MBA4302503.1 hypothetical protein [Cyclobacterium sp.]SDA55220.1 hypothetical protein SAMN03080617_00986 [Algoriphagus alkaliphilus]